VKYLLFFFQGGLQHAPSAAGPVLRPLRQRRHPAVLLLPLGHDPQRRALAARCLGSAVTAALDHGLPARVCHSSSELEKVLNAGGAVKRVIFQDFYVKPAQFGRLIALFGASLECIEMSGGEGYQLDGESIRAMAAACPKLRKVREPGPSAVKNLWRPSEMDPFTSWDDTTKLGNPNVCQFLDWL
jgi:hypothetical protein